MKLRSAEPARGGAASAGSPRAMTTTHHEHDTESERAVAPHAPARSAKDPVRGMTVDPARAKHQLEHDGQTDVDYTCPMHPQIVQKGPGSCPICGMALERKEMT